VQRIERQPAFVLHERPYRETSVLLEVLTRDHGRVGLVARGVRAAKPRFPRGTLKPLQALELSWQGRGELGTLFAADPVGTPVPLAGEGAFCALYVNELLARLLARNDPHPAAFARYSGVLFDLAGAADVAAQAWVLRRFERDLLAELGYGLALALDADGLPLDPAGRYSIDPEVGPVAWPRRPIAPAVSGMALLAMAADEAPAPTLLREIRDAMRGVLRHHLGGRELAAWSLRMPRGPVARVASPAEAGADGQGVSD
jgi:DNA repair protein RecO (recombination protein O)